MQLPGNLKVQLNILSSVIAVAMNTNFLTHHLVLKLTEEQIFSTQLEHGLLDPEILNGAIEYYEAYILT